MNKCISRAPVSEGDFANGQWEVPALKCSWNQLQLLKPPIKFYQKRLREMLLQTRFIFPINANYRIKNTTFPRKICTFTASEYLTAVLKVNISFSFLEQLKKIKAKLHWMEKVTPNAFPFKINNCWSHTSPWKGPVGFSQWHRVTIPAVCCAVSGQEVSCLSFIQKVHSLRDKANSLESGNSLCFVLPSSMCSHHTRDAQPHPGLLLSSAVPPAA